MRARRRRRTTEPAFYAFDVGFHQALTTHLRLDRSREALDGVRAHLERVRRMLTPPAGRNNSALAEHAAIAAAIASRDAGAARTAMDRHLAATAQTFEAFARERPELILA